MNINTKDLVAVLLYTLKWILIAALIGVFSGSASAWFLISLDAATHWRENHLWIIALLPLGGLLIGLMYHYLGKEVEKGNNLLIDEIHNPTKVIPFRMAPLIFIGTVLTHLFGGSAGREGTAVQMGGSIGDQLNHLFKFNRDDRMLILICGISAGFASVFGTPLAGAVFGLEVYFIGKLSYKAIFPSFLAAVAGDYVCDLWNVQHTHYHISVFPEIDSLVLFYCFIAGIAFGLTGKLFASFTHLISNIYKSKVSYPPLRPAIGGVIVACGVWLLGTTDYIGLGIPVIEASFKEQLPVYTFAMKLLFTSMTLGAAFKGGEVTPLFYIGATLGNALSLLLPLPTALLAGMGFVAVFAGAANTPLATIFMAIELFGAEAGIFAAIACVTSYLFSGHKGIYSSQIMGTAKPTATDKNSKERIS